MAAQVGARLRRVGRGREARVAERHGRARDGQPRLGRARRRQRDGPRQLRPALPPHVGDGPRPDRAVRAARAGAPRGRPDRLRLPPPRRRAHGQRRRGHRRERVGPRRVRRRPWRRLLTRDRRRVRGLGAGRRRHERRDRGQPRHGPAQLARPSRPGAEAPHLRRAGLHGRAHAGHRGGGGREPDRPRPDVALRRGHPQLGPDLDRARHPHPPGTVVAVARRDRQAPARPAVPRLRHARDAQAHRHDRSRPHLVRPHAQDDRARVRPLRLRAEPRHHRQVGQGAHQDPGHARRSRPDPAVHGPRRGLRGGARPRRPGRLG